MRARTPSLIAGMVLVSTFATLDARRCAGQVLYVDDDAALGGNGSGWSSAFTYLQDALFAAAADPSIEEIRVGGGSYYPDRDEAGNVTALDRSATFRLRNNLAVRGGYRGRSGHGNANHRDLIEFESVLSGDLAGGDTGAPDDPSHQENSIHIVDSSGTDASAVLDGFTIRGGMASGDARDTRVGGGLYNDGGSPTVISCRFEANYAGSIAGTGSRYDGGGGIYNGSGSQPEIRDCSFTGNLIMSGGVGAAMHNYRGSSPRIVGCLFEDHTNIVDNGAVRIEGYSDPVFEDCVFRRNSDTAMSLTISAEVTCLRCMFYDNGDAESGYGGAVSIRTADVTLKDCLFFGNRASYYGALSIRGGSLNVTSSVFSGNHTGGGGGAIYANSADVTVTNCTFTGNYTDGTGGAIHAYAANVDVWNSIFWGNGDYYDMGERGEIFWPLATGQINFSLVEGWTGSYGGVGNFDHDPLFVNTLGPDGVPGTPDDDVHLLPGSPCVNAAHNGAPRLADFDIDGEPRIQGCRVDIGADESGAAPSLADCNGNGVYDYCDVAGEMSLDCGNNYIPDECEPDCNGDGLPDTCDVLTGMDTDCNENGIPDSCDAEAAGSAASDCDGNGVFDACEEEIVALFDDFPTSQLNTSIWARHPYTSEDVDIVSSAIGPPYCVRLLYGLKLTTRELNLFNAGAARLGFSYRAYSGGSPTSLKVSYWNPRAGWVRFLTVYPGRWQSTTVDIPEGATLYPHTRISFWGGYPETWYLDDIRITHERGDCNLNSQRDDCDVGQGVSGDCNTNTRPDECDIAAGSSTDLDGFGVPDECHGFGDYDGNEVIALDDFAVMARCLAGPDRTPQPGEPLSPAACHTFFDSNGDGDVDLKDFARFGIGYTGPNP
ncbi:MAG: right-handed parallel beta-helix repeat-containing protein [Phycisphaerales bacterium]|nr:MAG: right-handed parallel beta-helix repeat-containing protein [Phycisphaerales bacterium]